MEHRPWGSTEKKSGRSSPVPRDNAIDWVPPVVQRRPLASVLVGPCSMQTPAPRLQMSSFLRRNTRIAAVPPQAARDAAKTASSSYSSRETRPCAPGAPERLCREPRFRFRYGVSARAAPSFGMLFGAAVRSAGRAHRPRPPRDTESPGAETSVPFDEQPSAFKLAHRPTRKTTGNFLTSSRVCPAAAPAGASGPSLGSAGSTRRVRFRWRSICPVRVASSTVMLTAWTGW